MQFVIPQFIDVEDKVIGPISVRQFITILIGAAVIFLNYELIYRLNNNFWFFFGTALVIGAATLVFAFIRVNGRPFHYFLLNFLATLKEPRLRIWSKEMSLHELKQKTPTAPPTRVATVKKAPTSSKLAVLSLIVDTGGAFRASSEAEEYPGVRVDRPLPPIS